MDIGYLEKQLTRHEGIRLKPYHDSVGKLTLGIGRNIEDIGISEEEALILLRNDILRVSKDLTDHIEWWSSLDEPRRLVLMNMAFNIGITRLLLFHKMLTALQSGDYQKAANEMKDSEWYRQIGSRALELENQMRTGTLL